MVHCPKCGRTQPNTVITCDCGYDLQAYQLRLRHEAQVYHVVSRPIRWLAVFEIALRVMGVLCVLGGVLGAILQLTAEAGTWQIILTLVGVGLVAVPYFAGAEAIAVLLKLSDQQPNLQRTLHRIEQALQRTNI